MNKNAKRWVAALRSGEFKQGRGVLRVGDLFCCLGVSCELAVRAGVDIDMTVVNNAFTYNGHAFSLPANVRLWLGLTTEKGEYIDAIGSRGSLTADNDNGVSFAQIANTIEAHESELFVKED